MLEEIQVIFKDCYAKADAVKNTNSKKADSKLYEFVRLIHRSARLQVMPDDHSKLVPLLPISNRTVKRLRADDSAGSRVKVGHRQALTAQSAPLSNEGGFLRFGGKKPMHALLSPRVSVEPVRVGLTLT